MSYATPAPTRDRVLLMNSLPSIGACVREIIEDMETFCVVGESHDETEALRFCSRMSPDIVLITLGYEYSKALQLIQTLRQFYPHCIVIVLSLDIDQHLQKSCIDAGAWVCQPIPCRGEWLKQTFEDCIRNLAHKTLHTEEYESTCQKSIPS